MLIQIWISTTPARRAGVGSAAQAVAPHAPSRGVITHLATDPPEYVDVHARLKGKAASCLR